jgi:hypothetical protein
MTATVDLREHCQEHPMSPAATTTTHTARIPPDPEPVTLGRRPGGRTPW